MEVVISQQNKIVLRIDSAMLCLHIENRPLVPGDVDSFEQRLCPTVNKTSAGQRHVWVFIQDVSLPHSHTSVGFRTRHDMSYFFVTGILRHPDRLCALVELIYSGAKFGGVRTQGKPEAQPFDHLHKILHTKTK